LALCSHLSPIKRNLQQDLLASNDRSPRKQSHARDGNAANASDLMHRQHIELVETRQQRLWEEDPPIWDRGGAGPSQ
jgi:hypothetical protein